MARKTGKALALSMVLVLLTGLTAYAQVQPRPQRQPGQRPAVTDPQRLPGAIDPALRQEQFFRFVSLHRLLAPPNRMELQRLSTMLGLTEEQRQSIRALYQQFFNTVKPVTDERVAAIREVLNIMGQPSPNRGAFQAAAAKVEQADRVILNAEFDFWVAFKGILNPQQQTQISGFMQQKLQGEMGERPPRAGGPPPPAPAPQQ